MGANIEILPIKSIREERDPYGKSYAYQMLELEKSAL